VYLLDTNIISELRRIRPHGAVVAWIEPVPDADLHISAVSLGEVQAGIEITREQDEEKAAELEAWADLTARAKREYSR
jgi:toxin FitB